MQKKSEEKTDWKKLFEIGIGTIMAFAAIAVIFAVMYFTFGLLRGVTGAAVSDVSDLGVSGWLVITVLTAVIVLLILKALIKKGFIKIVKRRK